MNLIQQLNVIMIDFPCGGTFACPECEKKDLKAYDTELKSWRRLNFLQHEAYLTAKAPGLKCNKCGDIRSVDVPRARTASGFTPLFEAMIMTSVMSPAFIKGAGTIPGHATDLR